jgi:hypothetical protein
MRVSEGRRTSGAARVALSTAITNTSAEALYEKDGWRRETAFLHYEYDIPKEAPDLAAASRKRCGGDGVREVAFP